MGYLTAPQAVCLLATCNWRLAGQIGDQPPDIQAKIAEKMVAHHANGPGAGGYQFFERIYIGLLRDGQVDDWQWRRSPGGKLEPGNRAELTGLRIKATHVVDSNEEIIGWDLRCDSPSLARAWPALSGEPGPGVYAFAREMGMAIVEDTLSAEPEVSVGESSPRGSDAQVKTAVRAYLETETGNPNINRASGHVLNQFPRAGRDRVRKIYKSLVDQGRGRPRQKNRG
jgi:hypothetical protein